MYNFFDFDEKALRGLMEQSLPNENILDIHYIETGWTNIVADVRTNQSEYIFRFPKNTFFANVMVKDCVFCELICGKMPCPTPDIKLFIDKNRPFSMHKKIRGVPLSSQRFAILSRNEKEIIAKDCAEFLRKLHALPISTLPIEYHETLNDFLINLASVHNGNYDFSKHNNLKNMEKSHKLCIVHGDFNSGNILIDDNNQVAAIIDFAFVSLSIPEVDIGRFWGRTKGEFGKLLAEAYGHYDMKHITEVVDLFNYVDTRYIDYLIHNSPITKIAI